jgi:hypothetical protein
MTKQISTGEMEFANYLIKYGKSYTTADEYPMRKDNYILVDKIIKDWNAKEDATHRLAHNKFSDWTEDEYLRIHTNLGSAPKLYPDEDYNTVEFDVSDLPDSVNWVTKGAVTPVDDVLLCAANWAMAAAGAIESSHFANTGKLIPLSA